jgi:CxxC motif-containing protein
VTSEKEVTCIICPIGCKIIVKTEGKFQDIVKGNKCKKGVEYARNEIFDPRRMLTSSMLVNGGEWPLVSVKSTAPIPKDKIFVVLEEIHKTTIEAPVKSHQIILKNLLNSGIDIIATKTIHRMKKE